MNTTREEKQKYPQAWENGARIDLRAIAHNYRALSSHCGVSVICVLKANAYGHGLEAVFDALQEVGARRFAVANLREAKALRARDEAASILILGNCSKEHMLEAQKLGIACTLFSPEQWGEMKEAVDPGLQPLRVELKVDTGFHRLGFAPDRESIPVIAEILKYPSVSVQGMYSHLALVDETEDRRQYQRLMDFMQLLGEAGISRDSLGALHLADSISAVDYPWARLDAVRIGAAVFGLRSDRPSYDPLNLQSAMTFWARVSQVRDLKAGEGIGYDYAFLADRDMRIATLSLGYGDGYPRSLSCGEGKLLLRGRLASVLGLICMDQLVVDVTEIPGVQRGDVALAWETDRESSVSAANLAAWAGTNKNEIVAGLTARVPREYV